jgi:hypothetical protein
VLVAWPVVRADAAINDARPATVRADLARRLIPSFPGRVPAGVLTRALPA